MSAMIDARREREPRRPARTAPKDDLAERMLGHIHDRASGRIRDLKVLCAEGVVTLQGRSRTQFAKQLAQEAALDLVAGPVVLANQIIVC